MPALPLLFILIPMIVTKNFTGATFCLSLPPEQVQNKTVPYSTKHESTPPCPRSWGRVMDKQE
jgi:hypothetical protein